MIDVGGVGYLVPARRARSPPCRAPARRSTCTIETQVRDESIMLYGFRDRSRARLVPPAADGPGRGRPGRARHLSVLAPDELARAVAAQDKAALARASGVGPRLAGRIVSELKDRLPRAAGALGRASPGRRSPAVGGAADARLGPGQSRLRPQRGPCRGRQGRRRAWRRRADRGADPHRTAGAGAKV